MLKKMPAKTTLIEGIVNIHSENENLLLKPGEQAIKTIGLELNKTPNIKQVIAVENRNI